MILVIDTNRIIAALIKDGFSRRIISNNKLNFITPDYTFDEIEKYKQLICQKAGILEENFDILMLFLFEKIDVVPFHVYERFLEEADSMIDDKKDVPFLACAITFDVGIWSDDKDFDEQTRIKIWKTKDLVTILK